MTGSSLTGYSMSAWRPTWLNLPASFPNPTQPNLTEVVMRAAIALGSFLALGGAFAVGLKAAPERFAPVTGWLAGLTGEQTASVSGSVRLGGRAVPGARVELHGEAGEFRAVTGADGSFSLGEVPPGEYGVTVHPDGPAAPTALGNQPPSVPERYREINTSGLTLDLQPGAQRRLINLRD